MQTVKTILALVIVALLTMIVSTDQTLKRQDEQKVQVRKELGKAESRAVENAPGAK